MSRRKAALPPEFQLPRRPSRSQQRGVGPAAVLAAGSQQGLPLEQQGATAAARPSQPSLGNQPQQDSGAAALGSVPRQSSASGQQVWTSMCPHACVPPLYCGPVVDVAASLHRKWMAGNCKAAQVLHVLAGLARLRA